MTDTTITTEQLAELGRRWAEAELAADAATLDALIRDDFVGVGPLGFVLDKRQWLGPRRAGDLRITAFDWARESMRVFGDTAVVVGTQTQAATYQGRDASGRFRVTQIATRAGADAGWRLAGMHLSPIAAPPAPPERSTS